MPTKGSTAVRIARTAPTFLNISVLRAGTKADRPNQRKNKAIHQPEIVAGILHSP